MKFYFKVVTVFLMVFLASQALSDTARITNFRFSNYSDKTRIVFEVNGTVNYTPTEFSDKLTIEIKKTRLVGALKKLNFTKTPISSILSSQSGGNLLLTFNLKHQVKLRHFLLANPHRLVLDLYPIEKKEKVEKEPVVVLKPQKPLDDAKPQHALAQSEMLLDDLERDLINKMYQAEDKDSDQRQVVVVIDPGHGGADSGAIGCSGTREKDVTLAMSKALQRVINSTKGFHAILTRNDDYFIPLRERLDIAHRKKADMFISIHADAYINRRAHGISIFALSQRGATSEAARWLADKENESELGHAISDKNNLLRSVLIDLAQTATISASLDIGRKILKALSGFASLHFKEVEQAAFVVLKSPDIPSLLVEVGFLTYAAEEMKLRNAGYQEEIATKLATGIQSYFVRRPPQGTYLAKIKHRGDLGPISLQDSLPSG